MAPLDNETAQDVHEIIEQDRKQRVNSWATWLMVAITAIVPFGVATYMKADMAPMVEVQTKYDELRREDRQLQRQIIDMRETVTRTETKIDMLLKSGGLRFEPR